MRSKEFIAPTSITQLSSIFSGIVRVILIICLLAAKPLSSGNILIVFFVVSIARHLLAYFSEPAPDNIFNFFLDLLTPCLYGFLLYHALSVYKADLFVLSVSIFLPAVMYCILFSCEPYRGMGNITFWGGIFCYVLSFLLALNYSFDTSGPVVEKYFLAKKFTATTRSEDGGEGGDNYYFDLIHVDSIATPPHWVTVNRKDCNYYHHSWMYKKIKLENETFIILDKKTSSNPVHQCSFLVQKTGPFQSRIMTEKEYARYEKGDTFKIEKHKGLLGIGWQTYQ